MPSLLDPVKIGSLRLPNRILMAPLTRARSNRKAVPNELMAAYYAQRADAGLIISEATGISREALGWPNAPGLWNAEQVEGWKTVTSAVHERGGRIVAQLWHMGRLVHPDLGGGTPVSASATTAPDFAHTYDGKKPYVEARPATLGDIQRIIADYGIAARNAVEAGFDGVQIHAANGYLIDQFLRDGTNFRTDLYGGSIENRIRLASEVLESVGEAIGMDRVGIRFSPNLLVQGVVDSDPVALFKAVAQRLQLLQVPWIELREPYSAQPGGPEPTQRVSPAMRPLYSGKIFLNGGFDIDRARQRMAEGVADGISFGRPFISNPDLVSRIVSGAPLSEGDSATYYGGGAQGYVDYPTFEQSQAA